MLPLLFLTRGARKLSHRPRLRFVLALGGLEAFLQESDLANRLPTEHADALFDGLQQVERHKGSLTGWTDTEPPTPRPG
jgi:hypothetical protein